jgi:hypothetical protein
MGFIVETPAKQLVSLAQRKHLLDPGKTTHSGPSRHSVNPRVLLQMPGRQAYQEKQMMF